MAATPTGIGGSYGIPTKVAAIPDVRTSKVEEVVSAMKEVLEVREGVRGDGLDKAVTLRDLLNSGIATPLDLRRLYDAGTLTVIPPHTADPDIPPTPQALEASGAFKYIMLTWDFARGYNRLTNFEVWRSSTDALGDAVQIAAPYGSIYADEVGPGATFYYWVRAVSDAGKSPFNAQSGVRGATMLDTTYLMGLLTGQITETQLYKDLGDRIALIDAADTVFGSVAARIASSAALLRAEFADTAGVSAAYVQNYAYSKAETGQAIASATTTLQTTVDGHTGSIQTNATSIDGLKLQYTVKLDNNGYVSGYGLASTPVNGVPFASFTIRADSFSIASPTGPGIAPSTPFIVRTTPTTLNGVLVPAGVYIKDVFLQNGSIVNATLGNLSVDDAKIANMSVAKLKAGALAVSEYIESSNYAAGAAGFRISGNGNAELNNAVMRGGVYASYGAIGGISINSIALFSSNYSSTTGFALFNDGSAYFNNAFIRGQLIAASGTLGIITAATIQSAASGQRVVTTERGTAMYDQFGNIRVLLGDDSI